MYKERQNLNYQIKDLRSLLETAAEECKYNFHHPKVVDLSQKLDRLILQEMKEKVSIG